MSCQTYESLIALDVGGDLPAADAGRLTRHLEMCPACRRFAEEMRQSRQAVALLAEAPVDEEILAAVRARVLRSAGKRSAVFLPFRPSPRVLAWAAAVAVSLGALFLVRFSGPEPEVQNTPRRIAEVPVTPRSPAPPPPEARSHFDPEEPKAVPSSTAVAAPDPIAPDPVASAPIEQSIPKLPKPRPPVTVSEEIRTTAVAAPATPQANEPMVIKLVSEDADLVIYWLVNASDEGTNKETKDEISAV